MKRPTFKAAVMTVMVLMLLLKEPVSKSTYPANLYTAAIALFFGALIICLILLDSRDKKRITELGSRDMSLLCKYRAASVLCAALIMIHTVAEFGTDKAVGVETAHFIMLLAVLLILWLQRRCVQGAQIKFNYMELAISVLMILLIFFLDPKGRIFT